MCNLLDLCFSKYVSPLISRQYLVLSMEICAQQLLLCTVYQSYLECAVKLWYEWSVLGFTEDTCKLLVIIQFMQSWRALKVTVLLLQLPSLMPCECAGDPTWFHVPSNKLLPVCVLIFFLSPPNNPGGAHPPPIVNKEAATDDPRRRKPDISLAKRVLKWEPKVSFGYHVL